MGLALNLLGETALKQVVRYVNRDPENGLKKILEFMDKIPFAPDQKQTFEQSKKALYDPENNWRRMALRVFKELNPKVRERLIINLILNSWFLGVPKQNELSEKYDINVPYAILMDPTAKCNLRCTGCWAGDYDKKDELDFDTMDRIIREARELGIYFVLYSGGEPLIRKDDLLALAEKYDDMAFQAFTNGTLIDRDFAKRAAQAGNFAFAISLEGFRETTDARRGSGTFDRVMEAMDYLREEGVMFGFSVTYTRQNTEEVGSEEFMDFLIDKGCIFGWLFTYIPIGRDENLDLMATPEQRAFMYNQVQYFRHNKPIAAFDFWNDGDLVNGCIAGGRRYLHINAHGDIEPCAFVHFATHNIKDISLFDALNTPLMNAYKKRQPFNCNHLRPCPIIDNPDSLAEMVQEAGAYPTQTTCCTNARELADKLENYAQQWGQMAEAIREKEKQVSNF